MRDVAGRGVRDAAGPGAAAAQPGLHVERAAARLAGVEHRRRVCRADRRREAAALVVGCQWVEAPGRPGWRGGEGGGGRGAITKVERRRDGGWTRTAMARKCVWCAAGSVRHMSFTFYAQQASHAFRYLEGRHDMVDAGIDLSGFRGSHGDASQTAAFKVISALQVEPRLCFPNTRSAVRTRCCALGERWKSYKYAIIGQFRMSTSSIVRAWRYGGFVRTSHSAPHGVVAEIVARLRL